MSFTLFPAVDVVGGRVARLDGQEAGGTPGDPLSAALALQAGGAEWIHLVDLDAAYKTGSNAELLASIVGELDIKVELSGGINQGAALDRALATGCERVVVGTEALPDRAWCAQVIETHGERIAVALDVSVVEHEGGAVQHRLVPRGGSSAVGDLWKMLAWLDHVGCARYIVTDVARDGMLSGPSWDVCHGVGSATPAPVIVSGGIASTSDLAALAAAAEAGANFEGAIVGKALHTGLFTLAEALEAVQVP